MPAIRVNVDGSTIATVCTDGCDVLTLHIAGDRSRTDHAALLDLGGGRCPGCGPSEHTVWLDVVPLRSGGVVEVAFEEAGESSFAGLSVDEPRAVPAAGAPLLRERCAFRLETSNGTRFSGATAPDEQGFGCLLVWDSARPEQARLSLHSYRRRSAHDCLGMQSHVAEALALGASMRLELVA